LAFVNSALIFGGLLVAIPIVLHLVMRQQPKPLLFPAVRFIRQRHDTNRRQLQLRHWLLLLLRCLAVALPAVALARPSVGSRAVGDWAIVAVLAGLLLIVALLAVVSLVQRRGRAVNGILAGAACVLVAALGWMWHIMRHRETGAAVGNERAPVAALLVFDSAVRMQYRWENQTRLAQAQEITRWLIRQLPPDSEVSVIDSRAPRAVFSVDLAAAARSIERMETTCIPQPIGQRLEEAVRLARTSAKSRREVYLFTDLTRQAWSSEAPARLQRALAEANDVLLYVVDVGVARPRNLALGDVTLSSAVLSRSSQLEVKTTVDQVGAEGSATVELYLEDADAQRPFLQNGRVQLPESRLRDQRVVELAADGGRQVTFRLRNLEPGVHQGHIQLATQDGLAIDNVRHFTVEVQEATPVLVLAPQGVVTKYFVEMVAPYEFRQDGRARYDCTVRDQAELVNVELDSYAAVCLLDPGPLTPRDWERLAAYVRRGRGLALFLGHNAVPALFNDPAAYPLLGGKVALQWRAAGGLFLTPRNLSHPVTAAFRDIATAVPWNQFPVYRHWVLEDLSAQSQVIVPYSNNRPAVIETTLGEGRVLVMTTPISDPARLRGREPWNELPTGEDPWPLFVLVNEMLGYLVDTAGTKLNYLAAETAVLVNSRDKHPDRYELFTPLNQPQEVTAADGRLTVKFTEYPGAYRLKGLRGGTVIRGFCVNVPRTATDLTRLSPQELDAQLGADRYRLARSTDELAPGVGEARLGREFYPALWLLFGLILALEQVLANRFYRPATELQTAG
jgi:hypothetical protein